MFHTIEASLELTSQTFYYYKNWLSVSSELQGIRYYEKPYGIDDSGIIYQYEMLKNMGIRIKLNHFQQNWKGKKTFHHFYLILEVNPKRILSGSDFLSVTSELESKFLFLEITRLLEDIGIPEDFNAFSVRRIDYCYNHKFDSQEKTEFYIEILKRAVLLDGFSVKRSWDRTKHRSISCPNAIYASNKSVTINFYNKQAQMRGIFEDFDIPMGLAPYAGVVRFEIQCMKPKIGSIKRAYHLPTYQPCYFASDKIGYETLSYYINKIFPKGDFYTLDEAEKIVLSSGYRDESKKTMIDLLDLASQKRSLQVIIDILQAEDLLSYCLPFLKKLDEIGVNPVTIPERWGIRFMPNPIRLIGSQLHE